MDKTLESTKTLVDQVYTIRTKYASMMGEGTADRTEALQTYFKKVDKLLSAADQIKMNFISLKEDNDRLQCKAKSIDCARDLSQLYVNDTCIC